MIAIWMLFTVMFFLGLFGTIFLGLGMFISLIVNLALLPLRILIWLLRSLLWIF
ncbi:MAG TPA: hypothetical protein VM050_02140 [Patescibacteria group bacterium]|nr:hypothetical protein [Patescibacteria group bacterium]